MVMRTAANLHTVTVGLQLAHVSVKRRISSVLVTANPGDKSAMRVLAKLIPLSGPLHLVCNFQPPPGVRELRYRS